jgi:hypothetical protein
VHREKAARTKIGNGGHERGVRAVALSLVPVDERGMVPNGRRNGAADAAVAEVQIGHRAGSCDRAAPNGGSRPEALFIVIGA